MYFEGADDAFFIIGMDALSGLGVNGGQPPVEGGPAGGGDFRTKAIADVGIGSGAFEESVEEGLDVHGRAADGDDGPAGGGDGVDGPAGQVEKAVHTEGFGGLGDVDEVNGDLLLFFGGRFCGADVHSPIDFHGIDADDLSAEGAGQIEGERSLSGCGDS